MAVKKLVCIPAFNEELTIGSIVLISKQYCDHVFVINDGSTDNTAKIAGAAGAKIIAHKKNMGYGAAINSCFETALKENAGILVIIDGDGQHDAADIPLLIAALKDGIDIVVGNRFLKENKIPGYRKAGIYALTKLTNFGSGTYVSDSQSGFRAYNSKAIRLLFGLKNKGMGAGSEILIYAAENGLKIAEAPISVKYFAHSKRNAFLHGMGVVGSIVDLLMVRKPLVFFGIAGLFALAFGGAFGFYTIGLYNADKALPFGPTILTVFFCLIGILCIFSAVMLDSFSKLLGNQERKNANV